EWPVAPPARGRTSRAAGGPGCLCRGELPLKDSRGAHATLPPPGPAPPQTLRRGEAPNRPWLGAGAGPGRQTFFYSTGGSKKGGRRRQDDRLERPAAVTVPARPGGQVASSGGSGRRFVVTCFRRRSRIS